MSETYSLGLSLLDFVPNLAFLCGVYDLFRLTRFFKGRLPLLSMIVGASLVFIGGTSKAIWKMVYTLGFGDIYLLSEAQFVLLAPGFLLMLASVIWICRKERKTSGISVLDVSSWKIPLLAIMTLDSPGTQGILSYIAFRRKMYLAGVMYIFAIFCMLAMAGMASGEQDITRQWMEEVINSLGQIALGSFSLFAIQG